MKVFKILAAVVALALGASTFADAETLRTAPFPGYHLIEGAAHCAVVNGSGTGGQATLLLYEGGERPGYGHLDPEAQSDGKRDRGVPLA